MAGQIAKISLLSAIQHTLTSWVGQLVSMLKHLKNGNPKKHPTPKKAHPVNVPEEPAQATGKHQLAALDTLDEITNKQRNNLKEGGHDPDMVRVRVKDWRDACIGNGIPRERWYEAKSVLDSKRLIEIKLGDYVHRRTEEDD
jgi:hypothetical protein